MKPTISIIVPVYNCGERPEFLSMLQSLAIQNYDNFEVLLCDDGSEDNTERMCRDWCSSDGRFRYIRCEHGGVSNTRNRGLRESKGEWITFVDADDILTGAFLEGLIRPVEVCPEIDMVFGSFLIVTTSSCAFLYKDEIYKGPEEIRNAFTKTNILQRCSPWGKLFKAEIIRSNSLEFSVKLSHSEDRLFIYNYLHHVNAIATSSTIGYIYGSYSSSSLKHEKQSEEQIELRQKLISGAARNLLNRFGLSAQDVPFVTLNLLNLLKESARSLHASYPKWREARPRVENYFEKWLTSDIADLINTKEAVVGTQISDIESRLLLQAKFKELFKLYGTIERKIRLKQVLSGCLGRHSGSGSFANVIKCLNYKI